MSALKPPISDKDHIAGNPKAHATLVEYGDYQCPFCGQAHPVVKRILKALGDKICFVFRNFPLREVHPYAERAAEAAESAGSQGRFWEMHDILFENQQALDDASLLKYAKAVGVDPQTVLEDLKTGKFEPRVRDDFVSGVRSGVNGTPAFFLNGTRLDIPFIDPTFVETIKEAALATDRV